VKVELQSTASVDGDIATPVLLMADGAVVTGKVDAAGRKRSS
jgi:cytoskeletal protein CcmA (bactofilin family)